MVKDREENREELQEGKTREFSLGLILNSNCSAFQVL
jgi:hypothetical protein